MTPNEIAGKKFDAPRKGMYDAAEVDAFLTDAAAFAAQLLRENSELKRRLEASDKKLDSLQKDSASIGQALLNAQRLADNIVRDAQAKADITMNDAQIKAEQLKEKVKSAILEEHKDFEKMKEQVADFREKVLGLYKEQVAAIMKTPGEEISGEDADAAPEAELGAPAEPVPAEDIQKAETVETDAQAEAASSAPVPAEGEAAAAPSSSATVIEAAATPVPDTAPAADPAAAGQQDAAPSAKPDPRASRLNLRYDEKTGEYVPIERKSRYSDLKFGSDYDIAQDEDDPDKGYSHSMFRKNRR